MQQPSQPLNSQELAALGGQAGLTLLRKVTLFADSQRGARTEQKPKQTLRLATFATKRPSHGKEPLMDLLQNLSDDQTALLGCFLALAGSGLLMTLSYYVGQWNKATQLVTRRLPQRQTGESRAKKAA